MNNNDQLELGFNEQVVRITVRRRQASRAKWWFGQMRRAVDSAMDWQQVASTHAQNIQLRAGRRSSLA